MYETQMFLLFSGSSSADAREKMHRSEAPRVHAKIILNSWKKAEKPKEDGNSVGQETKTVSSDLDEDDTAALFEFATHL